ncbi:MAG: ADP-ribosylglycohydrolase family protein [Bacteroidales bacterium]|nr:ADP-ribosylglycohydrolase family protein [Bacteroidales bacterium]
MKRIPLFNGKDKPQFNRDQHSCTQNLRLFIIYMLALLFSANLYAQKPAVAIVVWDEKAKEASDPAEIRIVQVGDPTPGLTVKTKTEGTASDGIDYRCFNNTWQMDKMVTFKIYPIDDGKPEGDETVTVSLVESPDYKIEDKHKSATITIKDGSLPDIEFVTPSSIGKESAENVELEITLSNAYTEIVELDYIVQGVLAEQGKDFQLNSGTLIIPAGTREASINLRIIDDNEAEDDETVVIRLKEARNANIETNHAHYYTIKNDDGALPLSIVHDRIYGALLGFRAGCSMGAATEYNWPQDRLENIFGLVDEFIPYVHYDDSWSHPAGATEDGGERHKLMCTAIMEKQDRIDANDLLRVWLRDCEIENMYHMTQPYDRILLGYAKWGVPPEDMPQTKYGSPYDLGEHIHLTARTFQAIPCINAGDPEHAIEDMNDLGRLYYENPNDDAFAWGAVYNSAMALAMLPGATVESVIEGALKYATAEIEEEIRYVLAVTDKYEDPMDKAMWKELTDIYLDPQSKYYAHNRIEKYINSSIYENVSYAFALFKATNANVQQSVIIAVNRGYDTDCTAASAGALCGALTGTSTIPEDWIETLDAGIANNPYTNAHFTNKATADGLYRALQNKVYRIEKESGAMKNNLNEAEKLKAYVELMRESGVIE